MTTETSSQQSIRKAGPYDRYTDEQKAKLRRMWLEGVVLKQIAFELGKTKGSVKKMRMVLKLPRRRTGDKRHQLRINVNEGIYRKMGLRAMQRRQSVADYVRMLVERDISYWPS
jgi:hypothetical protein